MENVNSLRQLLADISRETQQLAKAYKELDGHIEREAVYIDALDRISRIDAFKARLVRQDNQIKHEEEVCRSAFDIAKVPNSALGFAVGGLYGKIIGHRDPSSLGWKLSTKEFEKKSCFGTVMMALDKGCKIEETEVISISRLARESRTTEAEIISSLKNKGYYLTTPEDLWESLDYVKEVIKKGKKLDFYRS